MGKIKRRKKDYEDESDEEEQEEYVEEPDDQDDEDEVEHDVEEDETFIEQEFSVGKDRRTKWYASKPENRKTRNTSSVHYPGVEAIAKNLKSPYDCWTLFFDSDMLEDIVQNTNIYIDFVREEGNKTVEDANCSKHINLIELKAFIGLLYLSGVYKSNNMSINDLWKKDGTGIELFYLTMPLNRFNFLLDNLQFDDITTRENRKSLDKLAPIRDIFESFNSNLQRTYSISDLIFIKDKYESFRGKCSFKQYLPNTKSQYGIRMFLAIDAIMFYTFNIEIYIPNQVNGNYKIENSFKDIVIKLAEPILNDNRCIVVDQLCNFKLAKKLLSKKTYLIGKLNLTESVIPEHFLNNDTSINQNKNVKIGFTDDTVLVSYKNNNNTSIVISTRPEDEKADDIIEFVTAMHKMFKNLNDEEACIKNINKIDTRWPMIVFFSLLNIATKNSIIVSRCNGGEVESRKEFIRELSVTLCHEHLIYNLNLPTTPLIIKSRIAKITKSEIPTQALQISSSDDVGGATYRCQECPFKRKKKTKSNCKDCKKILCIDHLVKICTRCYEEQNRV